MELLPKETIGEIAKYLRPNETYQYALTCFNTLCLLLDESIWKRYYLDQLNVKVIHPGQTYYFQYRNLRRIRLVEITSDLCVFIHPFKDDCYRFKIHGTSTRHGIKYCFLCQKLTWSPQIENYSKVKPYTFASSLYSTLPTHLVFNNIVFQICDENEIKLIGTLTKNNYVNLHEDIWVGYVGDQIYHMDKLIYYYEYQHFY